MQFSLKGQKQSQPALCVCCSSQYAKAIHTAAEVEILLKLIILLLKSPGSARLSAAKKTAQKNAQITKPIAIF